MKKVLCWAFIVTFCFSMLSLFSMTHLCVSCAESSDGMNPTESNEKSWLEPYGILTKLEGTHSIYFGEGCVNNFGFICNLERENLIKISCTHVDGIKQPQDFISLYTSGDGSTSIDFEIDAITAEGTGTYYLEVESEHYRSGVNMVFNFVPSSSARVLFSGSTIHVPLNKTVYLDEGNFIRDEYNEIAGFSILSMAEKSTEETPEYNLKYGNLKILKPGDYAFFVEVNLGMCGGLRIKAPVTFHSDNTIKQIGVSGEPLSVSINGVEDISATEVNQNKEKLSESKENNLSSEEQLSNAFSMLDDEEDSGEGTASLDEFELTNSASETENDETEEFTEEDLARMLAGMIEGSLNQNTDELPRISVQSDAFLGKKTELHRNGMFQWPLPEGFSLSGSNTEQVQSGNVPCETFMESFTDGTERNFIYSIVYSYNSDTFTENYDSKINLYKNWSAAALQNRTILFEQQIILNNRRNPAYVVVTSDICRTRNLHYYQQLEYHLWYYRGGNTILYLHYTMCSDPGSLYEDSTIPTIDDFMKLFSQVTYSMPENREGIQEWLITEDDFVFDIVPTPDQHFISSNRPIKLSVEYKNKARIKKIKNVVKPGWTLVGAEYDADGQIIYIDSAVASIDQNGNIKVGKVEKATPMYAVAVSPNAYTNQTFYLVMIPKVEKIALSEKSKTIYVGDSIILTAEIIPETAHHYSEYAGENITWNVDNNNVISLENNHDGTASIQALAAGKTTVTLKEITSGKYAKTSIQVLVPVTDLTITGADSVVPGRKTVYKATVLPSNSGNKKVSWQINVDESIATIDKNGNLLVKKNAVSGTQILITCVAEGAPSEIKAEKMVVVQ